MYSSYQVQQYHQGFDRFHANISGKIDYIQSPLRILEFKQIVAFRLQIGYHDIKSILPLDIAYPVKLPDLQSCPVGRYFPPESLFVLDPSPVP